MLRKLGRLAVTVLVAYTIMVVILWAMQDRFIYPAPQYAVDPAPGFDVIALETADGLSLRAFTRQAQVGRPTIVYFHGNGGTLLAAANATRSLAAAGYGLLLVEYRGYGGNSGEPSEQGFYRDGRAAMNWLAEQGIAPADTIIVGNSIGGGTAVQMASEYSPSALMLTAPFLSLPDVAQDALPFVPAHFLMRDRFDNASKIDALEMPIFIMHGTADNVVPFEHGEALAKLSPAATFVAVEGAGHALSFSEDGQRAQLEWLDQLLSGGGGA
ncbi:alpha/beta hydrolase [Altererythrobacter lutimaris]|uniref:Alpha/beta hydrolase n=1 Tax=Altererythrobacter lutimaris TaxID=2743979 RepID=A0A850HC01_9SPHN|nr:alpha/beta hydrolase [Altererythrobacter lutimaris]NVE95289.1 alpha/beta hydrolase [Altererythrobacter lutimaris]